jgi:hypothetical protein
MLDTERPNRWTLRHVVLLYFLYLGCRVAFQLPQGPAGSLWRDPDLIQQSLARFQQMGMGTKAVVLLAGVPLYLWGELLPRETANLVHFVVVTGLWRHVGEPALRFVWHCTVVPVCQGLYNLAHLMASALRDALSRILQLVDWVLGVMLRLVNLLYDTLVYPLWDYAVLPLWRALSGVVRALWDYAVMPLWHALCAIQRAVIRCADAWHNYILVPLFDALRRVLAALGTLIWDWAVVPAWNIVHCVFNATHRVLSLIWDYVVRPVLDFAALVFSIARDLCLAVWRPVRDWLLDKFYRLCSLVYAPLAAVARFVHTVGVQGAALVSHVASLVYETVEVSRGFLASLMSRRNL